MIEWILSCRLSQLLATEEAQYQYELAQLQETNEQKKEKMFERASQMKQNREHAREALAQQLKEAKFRFDSY